MSSFRLGSDAYGEERGKEEKYFLHPKKTVLTKSFELPPDYAASSPKVQFHGRPTQRGGGGKKSTNNSEKNLYDGAPSLCLVASQLMWACCTFVDFAYCCTHNLAIESCATHAFSNSRKKKKKKKDK